MSYLLLIMENAERRKQRVSGQGDAECEAMRRFQENLKTRGIHLGSESLRSLADGSRVGKPVDGPFAEAKEIIGGFFHLDVATRDEALAIARECPASAFASVEVREVGPCNFE